LSAPPAIIAEVKKASPSKGVFRDDFDPVALVTAYHTGGAAAISVVTEPDHFQGRLEWIETIRATCDLPILRKDFIVDEIQVAESASIGADAILLIARILTDDEIARLSDAAVEANLEVLYEAHDAEDLMKIRVVNPRLVGVNARNLDNFVVDTGSFASLLPLIPSEAVAVAESGLENATQIQLLSQIGYRGFLIGETLIRADNPAKLISELRKPE
jgi:indole-3-glycerol phosphate synthase